MFPFLSTLLNSSEISEITSVKKEDVISTLQYLNLINYYKVRAHPQESCLIGVISQVELQHLNQISYVQTCTGFV